MVDATVLQIFHFPRLVCIDGPTSTNYGYSPGGLFEFCTIYLSASCTVYPNRAEDIPKEYNNQTTTSNIHINILFNYRTDQDKDTVLLFKLVLISVFITLYLWNRWLNRYLTLTKVSNLCWERPLHVSSIFNVPLLWNDLTISTHWACQKDKWYLNKKDTNMNIN